MQAMQNKGACALKTRASHRRTKSTSWLGHGAALGDNGL